jgi:CRP/FNR family transcriptional regulator
MATIKEIVAFLQKVPLLQGLNSRQLERLARRFVEREYKSGKIIVTQGQGGEGFFIVEAGKAEAVRQKMDGTRVVVNHFGPGDFFGELALLDDGLRTATVAATEDTKCLVLTRWDFLGTLKEDAEMAVEVLQELAKRFRNALDTL